MESQGRMGGAKPFSLHLNWLAVEPTLEATFPLHLFSQKGKSSLDFFQLVKTDTNVVFFIKVRWDNANFGKLGDTSPRNP